MNKYIDISYQAGAYIRLTQRVYQYDHGLKLRIHNLNRDGIIQVHYSVQGMNNALSDLTIKEGEVWLSRIPAAILAQPYEIQVYIYFSDDESGKTMMHLTMPIIQRPKPDEYTLDEEELTGLDHIISMLNESKAAADEATENANEKAEAVQSLINNEIATALTNTDTATQEAVDAKEAANAAALRAENATDEFENLIEQAEAADTVMANVRAATTNANTEAANARQAASDLQSTIDEVLDKYESKIDGAYIDDLDRLCLTSGEQPIGDPLPLPSGTGFETVTYDQETGYLRILDENDEDVVDPVYIGGGPGGGGGASAGKASITRITPASLQCVHGAVVNIRYTFEATDSAGDVVGDGAATWYVGGIKVATSTAKQGENEFDISKYLSVGANNVKVSISVDTGGESLTVTSKTWTVSSVNMYLDWNYDDATINTEETFTLRWTPYGDLAKTTHIIVDGEEVATSQTSRSGQPQTMTLDSYPHGSHLVELYLTAMVGEDEISSSSVIHDMIFAEDGNTTPIIGLPIDEAQITQYNTLTIPIMVYDPASITATVNLSVDGQIITTWTDVDRTVHEWNYTPNTSGEKLLTVSCGNTVKEITVTVDALDIDNEEVGGYTFRMKASDLAGNEALRSWNSNNVTATFSDNFDWNNGGLKTELDDNGHIRQYICVKKGTTMTINYKVFGNDAKINGKNLKVIFKPMHARDYDAKWLSCMDGRIGIELCANGGTVSSQQNTMDVRYAEGYYTEFEMDIYADSVQNAGENAQRYIQTYMDGVQTNNIVYAADDNFTQANKKDLVIGSEDCDVYIYMIKLYENYITRDNHIENFIADAPNAQEMVARYDRNNVLADNGEISYEKLAEQNQNLRVHLWDIPKMTQGKKDYVTGCRYQQIYKAGGPRHQLTADNVTINIQGTSSVDYKDSGANTDGNFTEGFTDGNGDHIDAYALSDDSIPVNYFNTKVNIASCENANNRCLAEWYNRYQPYKTLWRRKNPLARDCMEQTMGVQFIKDQSHGLFADDNYHMYAICNMGNSKNNGHVFHDVENPLECCVETADNNSVHCLMHDPNFDLEALDSEDYFEFRYPDSPTSEMKQAFINFVRWMAYCNPGAATNNILPSPVTYGAYTFVGNDMEGDQVLKGTTIDTYAGTYTTDSYEYRMAKMLNECEDHLVMDAMLYHYVFIEQHTMVDNVCKNTFWGTEDLVHWQLCKNYDNDTGDGNNNTGKLIIPYGCEGMDTLGDGDVFNGKTSVWWTFVHGLYDARRTMWLNRESAGAWDAQAYLNFVKEEQSKIPERVYNQDYWYKYLRLYETRGITTYIPMLEGGKKTHQREEFIPNNMYYMAGQYMGTACTSKSITLRGYTPSVWAGVEPESKIRFKLYTKGYGVVQVGDIFARRKANKGELIEVNFDDLGSGSLNDTVINIHGANLVSEVQDISCLYVGRSDFSAATRLRNLQIGSTEEGYQNNNLTEIGFGTNEMLERLFIQNCPNVNATLDLSGCQSLLELDVRGSGFTGITFAVGGLLETAKLCSPYSLSMRSLYNIANENFSMESFDNLGTLRLEDCTQLNSLSIVQQATNLNYLRLIGIDWTLDSTDLLNNLLLIDGLDESNHNTDQSVLTGEVYVPILRESERNAYTEAWTNLVVNRGTLVEQFRATYKNYDGTVLYETYVDRYDTAPDPIEIGLIAEPTKPDTPSHYYNYNKWDVDPTTVNMIENCEFTATFSEHWREYTVRWYGYDTTTPLGVPLGPDGKEKTYHYGDDAVFAGTLPTRNDQEDRAIYHKFVGWDKSTGHIVGDTNVYAKWEEGALPAVGVDVSSLNAAQIYAIKKSGRANEYFEEKDRVPIAMGFDPEYNNVETILIKENTFYDGATAEDTGIKLFENGIEDGWVLVADFEYYNNTAEATMLSCFQEDGFMGFKIRYMSNPSVQWSTNSYSTGASTNREIVVLRHEAGSRNLKVYCSKANEMQIGYTEMTKMIDTATDHTLVLGADRNDLGVYLNYATGMLHQCKLYKADLGEDVCSKIASWAHETYMWEAGTLGAYTTTDSKTTQIDFICASLLSRYHRMNPTNTNAGGFPATEMYQWIVARVIPALPQAWQDMMEECRVNYMCYVDGTNHDIQQMNAKMWLPSFIEMNGGSSEPWIYEGEDHIPYFTNNYTRIKYKGADSLPRENANVFTSATDPTLDSANTVVDGDVWVNTSESSRGYLRKHGIWLAAYSFFLRGASVANDGTFSFVSYTGFVVTFGYYATNVNGVCPRFSI